MSILSNLFGKKKKTFRATCDISKEPVESGYGYLLTTSEIVSSKKFWDNIMTEPETMSYTISHFKNKDETATQMRRMIFDKYSGRDKSWMISDSYIHLFDVDKDKARADAKHWWEQEGHYALKSCGPAIENMSDAEYQRIRQYAIMDAGKHRVS